MRYLRSALIATAALVAVSLPAAAQTPNPTTTITATTVSNGRTAITGTLCLTPSDRYGNAVAISKYGGGFYRQGSSFCQTLTAGSLAGSLSVPDSLTDSAPGHPYSVQIFDSSTSQATQPLLVYGISGSLWSLDSYIPPATTPTTSAFTFTWGSGSPAASCTAPALDVRVNSGTAVLYVCNGGFFTPASSSSASLTSSSVIALFNSGGACSGTLNSTGGCSAFSGTVYRATSVCDAGIAVAAAFFTPATNAPARGCANAANNPSLGYLDFPAVASAPSQQNAYFYETLPPNWTSTDVTLNFYSTATTGSANFSIQTACLASTASVTATPTWGTAVTVNTATSGTAGTLAPTATFTSIASNGVSGCAPGALLIGRLTRVYSDTLAADAFVTGATITTKRSS